MWHGGDAAPLERPVHPLLVERLAVATGEHDRIAAVAERPRRVEDLQRAAAQRDPVLARRLHPQGRNRPDAAGRVDLRPHRAAHFARPRGGEDHELERQLDGLGRLGSSHGRDRRRHVPVRHRRHVPHDPVLRAEHRPEPVAGIVGSQVHGDGPFHHRPDALAHRARRLDLAVPDRRENLQHVGAVDLRDRAIADAREGVVLQAVEPRLRLPAPAPAGALALDHGGGGLGEGRHVLQAALVGQGVAARACDLPVRERLVAGLGERD